MMEVLRIVLLGKCGAGKSSSGNTLLGSKRFHAAHSSQGVTQACSMSSTIVNGHKLCVVDTPGWTEDETTKITKCVDISDPGPHVLLLVLPTGHFTKEETDVANQILEVFGEEAHKYMMVLFTKRDDLEGNTIEEYLTHDPHLKEILKICGGRYHVINNRDKENPAEVSTLLEKLKTMVKKNEGKHYTKAMFQKAAEQMEDKQNLLQIDKEGKVEMSDSDMKSNNGPTVNGSAKDQEYGDTGGRDEYVVHIAKSHSEKPRSEKSRYEKSLQRRPSLGNHNKELHQMELKWQKTDAELQRVKATWLKEKDELEKDIQQLRAKFKDQRTELEKVKKELQQWQGKADTFEKLRQESQWQREELESMKREIHDDRENMKRRSIALQKHIEEFEKVIDRNKEADLKTTLRMFLSKIKKNGSCF